MRKTILALALVSQTCAAAENKAILIKAGRLIDVRAGRTLSGQSILIEGDRITQVGANLTAPAGARTIDLGAYTVLPGLIDNHTHILLHGDALPPSAAIVKAARQIDRAVDGNVSNPLGRGGSHPAYCGRHHHVMSVGLLRRVSMRERRRVPIITGNCKMKRAYTSNPGRIFWARIQAPGQSTRPTYIGANH